MNGMVRCPVCSGYRYLWGPQYALPCVNCKGTGVVQRTASLDTRLEPKVIAKERFPAPAVKLPIPPLLQSFPQRLQQQQQQQILVKRNPPPTNFVNDMTARFPCHNSLLGSLIRPSGVQRFSRDTGSVDPCSSVKEKNKNVENFGKSVIDREKRPYSSISSSEDDFPPHRRSHLKLTDTDERERINSPQNHLPSYSHQIQRSKEQRVQGDAREQWTIKIEKSANSTDSSHRRVTFRPVNQTSPISTALPASQTSASYEDLEELSSSTSNIIQYPPYSIKVADEFRTTTADSKNNDLLFSQSSQTVFERLGPPKISQAATPEKFEQNFSLSSGQFQSTSVPKNLQSRADTQSVKKVEPLGNKAVEGQQHDFRKRGLGPNELYTWDIRKGETRRKSIMRRFPHYNNQQVNNRLRFERRYDMFVMSHPVDPSQAVDRINQLREYTEAKKRKNGSSKQKQEEFQTDVSPEYEQLETFQGISESSSLKFSVVDEHSPVITSSQSSKYSTIDDQSCIFTKNSAMDSQSVLFTSEPTTEKQFTPRYRKLLVNLINSSYRTPYSYGPDRGSTDYYITLSKQEEIQFYTLIVVCMEEKILPQETIIIDMFRPLIQSWANQFGSYMTAAQSAIEQHLSSSDFQSRETRFHARLRELLTIHSGPPHRFRVWIANWALWSNMARCGSQHSKSSRMWGSRIPPFTEMIEAYNDGRPERSCEFVNATGFEDLDIELSKAYPYHPPVQYDSLDDLVRPLEEALESMSKRDILREARFSNSQVLNSDTSLVRSSSLSGFANRSQNQLSRDW